MKVTVRFLGSLRVRSGNSSGVRELDLPEGAPVASALQGFGPDSDHWLTLVNDARIGRDDRGRLPLAGGDIVTVLPPIRGG